MDDERMELFAMLLIELEKAERKHPEFPKYPAAGINIIVEELLELVRTVNDNETIGRQREEACHVAVTAMRFIEAGLKLEHNK